MNRGEERTQAPKIPRGPAPVNRAWRRTAACLYFLLLTFVLLSPDPLAWVRVKTNAPEKPWSPWLAWIKDDKLQHAVAYFGATLILSFAGWPKRWSFAAAVVHGGVIELLQPYSPPRTADPWDWAADIVGAAVGVGLTYLFFVRRPILPPG